MGPCTGTCAAAPPDGWQGIYAIQEATGASATPCSGAFPNEIYTGFASPVAPDASCACACGPPEGGTCAAPSITFFSGSCKATSVCGVADASTATCLATSTPCGGLHAEVGGATPVPGTCAPAAATTVPDAGWTASARLCAGEASGACDAGEQCVTSAGGNSEASCISKPGDEPCPPGPYSHRRLYYGSADDTRACSACACSPPDAACTGGTVTTYSDLACSTASGALSVSPTCATPGATMAVRYQGDAVLMAGSCSPSGGAPTGAFAPANPTTICCTQ
ncbi:MAG TPA: hypothetical protein VHV30_07940 [Polyangiaceae bacterium]|nr:hypothetical protein [Polyangiaceae bacterium]